MKALYLSSDRPRVPLTSEDDLRRAAEQGLLEENHYLDLKREIKFGKAENKELARDLASFAVDSGTLLIGIAEQPSGMLTLVPQPLDGLAERIEQIATTIPDPPLAVVTHRIPYHADVTTGYLVVHVPASPAAPHMVDGRYMSRGDKTKRTLSDPEVLRLHERRRQTEAEADGLLDAEFDRDPVPEEERRQAHLFLLAAPLSGRPAMLQHLTYGEGWQQRLVFFVRNRALAEDVNRAPSGPGLSFTPDIDAVFYAFDRRPGGVAATSGLTPGRRWSPGGCRAEDVVELEVHDDGGLRIFMSRLSDRLPRLGHGLDVDEQVLFEAALVTYTCRLVALVVGAAEEAGYFGNWVLAAGATGLRGCRSFLLTQHRRWLGGGSPYSGDVYRRTSVTSHAELTRRPGLITDRLIGQLLRDFDAHRAFGAVLTDKLSSEPPEH